MSVEIGCEFSIIAIILPVLDQFDQGVVASVLECHDKVHRIVVLNDSVQGLISRCTNRFEPFYITGGADTVVVVRLPSLRCRLHHVSDVCVTMDRLEGSSLTV